MESPFLVLSQVARILEEHQITYVLVGSLASSMHGMYRSTADIDLLADIRPEHVRPLLDALNKSFLGVTDFSLEFDYLRDWSDRLGVRDLLDRALTSARDRSPSRDNP